MPRAGKIALAAVVAVAAAGGYWAFASWQKQSQQAAIGAVVGEASAILKAGLGGSPAGDELRRIDAALERLRATKASRQRALAEAAEVYLVGARAVLQRKAEAARLGQQAAASRRQLLAHMSGPRGRDEGWIRQAADLKKRMDQAYFDENVALEALVDLLRALPEAEERLVPQVGRGALVEGGLVESAVQRTQEELKRASGERAGAANLIVR